MALFRTNRSTTPIHTNGQIFGWFLIKYEPFSYRIFLCCFQPFTLNSATSLSIYPPELPANTSFTLVFSSLDALSFINSISPNKTYLWLKVYKKKRLESRFLILKLLILLYPESQFCHKVSQDWWFISKGKTFNIFNVLKKFFEGICNIIHVVICIYSSWDCQPQKFEVWMFLFACGRISS